MDNLLDYAFLKFAGAKEGVDYKIVYQVIFTHDYDREDVRIVAVFDNKAEAQDLCDRVKRRDPTLAGQYTVNAGGPAYYKPGGGEQFDILEAKGTCTYRKHYSYPK